LLSIYCSAFPRDPCRFRMICFSVSPAHHSYPRYKTLPFFSVFSVSLGVRPTVFCYFYPLSLFFFDPFPSWFCLWLDYLVSGNLLFLPIFFPHGVFCLQQPLAQLHPGYFVTANLPPFGFFYPLRPWPRLFFSRTFTGHHLGSSYSFSPFPTTSCPPTSLGPLGASLRPAGLRLPCGDSVPFPRPCEIRAFTFANSFFFPRVCPIEKSSSYFPLPFADLCHFFFCSQVSSHPPTIPLSEPGP